MFREDDMAGEKNYFAKRSEFDTPVMILICIAIGIGISSVTLLVSCAVAMLSDDPEYLGKILAVSSVFVSVIVTSAIAAKLSKGGAVAGALTGAAFALILTLISLLANNNGSLLSGILLRLTLPAVGALTSLVFAKRKKRTDFRKKYFK